MTVPTNDIAPIAPTLSADDLTTQVLRRWLRTTGWHLFSVSVGRKSRWYQQRDYFPNGCTYALPEEVAYDHPEDALDARYRPRGEVLAWFLDAIESLAPLVAFDLDSEKFHVSRSVTPSVRTFREGIIVLRASLADAGFNGPSHSHH